MSAQPHPYVTVKIPIDMYRTTIFSFEKVNYANASIALYSKNKMIVDLRFSENPSDDVIKQPDGAWTVHEHINRYSMWIENLRNYSTLYVLLYPKETGVAARCLLMTGLQLVGQDK
jgi:hypothetical protein